MATAIVSVIQVVTKFTAGGWIVVLLIPAIIWMLTAIHRHYSRFAEEIRFTGQSPIMPLHHTVVVPVHRSHQLASHSGLSDRSPARSPASSRPSRLPNSAAS